MINKNNKYNNIINNNINNNIDNNVTITCKFCGKSHYENMIFCVINKSINVRKHKAQVMQVCLQ